MQNFTLRTLSRTKHLKENTLLNIEILLGVQNDTVVQCTKKYVAPNLLQ